MIYRLSVVIFLWALGCVECAPTLCAYYKTNGPGQLAVNEGDEVTAPNGDRNFLASSAQECVAACEVVVNKCGKACCNSVTYNPNSKVCWLKSGGSQFESSVSEQGWQSFWRIGIGSFNGDSADQLVTIAGGAAACESDLIADGYSAVYVSKGIGQLSVNEGAKVAFSTGESVKQVNNKDECAIECQAVKECDGFTVNISKKECYLKKGASPETKFSNGGWTSYWEVSETQARNQYCNSQEWYCLYCGGQYGDSCRNY
eukprot:TRINITY_DN4307_c0_g1_i2.p1 TRINITY_DN4307_c0_g1~~TRINITY_DN4307_c0_g1_i2.p1  ORF type:complete len:258 (-),score=42.36 TRINITY_DN4307_c0_g1_i2:131-904(-)